jgi:hypothetical protein
MRRAALLSSTVLDSVAAAGAGAIVLFIYLFNSLLFLWACMTRTMHIHEIES